MSTRLDPDGLDSLLDAALVDAGIISTPLPDGLEVVTRTDAGTSFTFYVGVRHRSHLYRHRAHRGSAHTGVLVVPAGAVRVVESARA